MVWYRWEGGDEEVFLVEKTNEFKATHISFNIMFGKSTATVKHNLFVQYSKMIYSKQRKILLNVRSNLIFLSGRHLRRFTFDAVSFL